MITNSYKIKSQGLYLHRNDRVFYFLRMTEIDEMESDDNNHQYKESCDVTNLDTLHTVTDIPAVTEDGEEEGAADDDLEEGECSSDEEPVAPVEMVEERDHRRKSKSHRRTRSRSRDRHKRSRRDRERERKELDADEKKVNKYLGVVRKFK